MRKSILILLMILAAFPSNLVARDKKVKYGNGDYYEGEWKKKAPHGYGVMKYANGDVYSGNWDAGVYSGRGTLKRNDGLVYVGDWVAGRREGEGKLYLSNADSEQESDFLEYVGGWKNDVQSGFGTVRTKAYTYVGEWENGELSGKGKIQFNDSDVVIEGKWIDGDLVEGVYDDRSTGMIFTGKFEGGPSHGKMEDSRGYLEGDWKDYRLYSGTVKQKSDLYEIDGVMDSGVFEGTIKALEYDVVFNGKVARHLSEGTFQNGSVLFEGRFADWFPKKGNLLSPYRINNLFTSDRYCYFNYTGKDRTFLLSTDSTLDCFEGIIKSVEEDSKPFQELSVYDKYLKNKRFIYDYSVFEAIHRKVILCFLKNGQVARIWKNYVVPRQSGKKQNAGKGEQTCPACHGKGYHVGHDFDTKGQSRETYTRCPMCLGRGIVDSDNTAANILSDFQKDVQYSALYSSLYRVDKTTGERVYLEEDHGEESYAYSVNGDRIEFDGKEYTINLKTGNLSRGDDIYYYDETTSQYMEEALRKAKKNAKVEQQPKESRNEIREAMLESLLDLYLIDTQEIQ